MNEIISIQQLQKLRNEFRLYLHTQHPEWNEITISTNMSDAFFGFNNNIGADFWASLVNDESIIELRNKIRDHFEHEKKYDNPEARANHYLSSIRLLKTFLDEKHPTLAKDWSGKAVSNTYLKSDFQSWMRRQKKPDGEPYSNNTINTYTNSLKNATGKLNLGDEINSDLFYYITSEEFEEAHKAILSAGNFSDVEIAYSNKSYSNGMILYSKFLKEIGEPSCWIFQGNPKYYDVVGAVESLDTLTWAVNQYTKQIKKDDRAYIWLSGSKGGIIASGNILCNPEIRPHLQNDTFNRGISLKKILILLLILKLTEN